MSTLVNPHLKFSYRHYASLPDDGRRFELLDGELVEMSPAPLSEHQRILMALSLHLANFVRRRRLGEVMVYPIDVILADDVVVQPDLLFLAQARRHLVKRRGVRGGPDLVIEVLSADAKRDREIKRRIYGRHGIREYWIVDPEARTIEVLDHPEKGFVLRQAFPLGTALTTPMLPGLELPIDEVFSDLDVADDDDDGDDRDEA
jgi:Uma2 family endonuclease